jgi:LPS export ABC transporter protein LptC
MKTLVRKCRCLCPQCVLVFMILMGSMVFCSCKNDIETINALTNEIKLPDQSGFNIEISYTDSGRLQGKIYAPEVNKFDRAEEPYIEFPKGMKVVFYDSLERPTSYIRANYAIYYEKKQLWEARNQVVAENQIKGEKLETEQMFWDQQAERIYSEKFTRLTNSDGISYGEGGFESRQDMSKWRLKGSSGTLNVSQDNTPGPK